MKGTRNAQPVQELRARISEAEQQPIDPEEELWIACGDERFDFPSDPWSVSGWCGYDYADPVEVPSPLARIADIRPSFMRPTT